MSIAKPFHSALIALTLVLVAFLLHAPVLGLTFFSDDFSVIHRIGVQGDLGTGSFFRPLPDWTLYLNHLITGASPIGFRVVNVFLLGFNGWLVYLLGRNLMTNTEDTRWSPALVAALLFVCYPFHNEPQLWIIGRSTAMATMFTLLALVVATSHASLINKCITVGLCGAIGAMCYELALLLPLLLAVMFLLTPKQERRTWWAMVFVASAVAGSNLLLRSMFTGNVANDYGASFFSRDITSYFSMSAKVFGRLLLPPDPAWAERGLLLAALSVALLVIAFLLLRRTKNEPVERKLFIALAGLTVVACGIAIVGGVSTRTSESDRFLYLPSAFLCLLIASSIFTLVRGWSRLAVVATLVIASVFAMRQNHANWIAASGTITQIVRATPQAPILGHLFVHGLPGDHNGAFIFRHGFHEALLFAEHDTSRVIRADTLWSNEADNVPPLALSFENKDDTLHVLTIDRLVRWNGKEFDDMPH